ncbi:MAG: hypothetical protein PHD67_07825 [Oscillospiraceae bacterium]|nr:hypothetical protein [Oscillospiraceae bacterium]
MARRPVGGGTTFLISFLAILLVCALGAVLVMTVGNHSPASSQSGGDAPDDGELVGMDVNAIQLDGDPAQEQNPRGTVFYQINAVPFFSSGSSDGTLMISSSSANVDLIRVEISLEEDETSVYQSDFIRPGYGIPTAKMAVKLGDGVYPAIATIQVYDTDTREYLGSLKEALTLYVGVSEEEKN